MKQDQENITFRFIFKDGSEKIFPIEINPESYEIAFPKDIGVPEWTLRERILCPIQNCIHKKFCPIAFHLDRVIKLFDGVPSYEQVTVYVDTKERTYSKQTSLQAGAGSLIGIIMTTSGCHVLDKLRPMVYFHLPFATLEETEYRTFSMFLFAQFLRQKNGLSADWQMSYSAVYTMILYRLIKTLLRKLPNWKSLMPA